MTNNEDHHAYLAGLLDSTKGEITPQGKISFWHEDQILTKWLVEHFGGNISFGPKPNTTLWEPNPEDREEILGVLLGSSIARHSSVVQAVEYLRKASQPV